MAQINSSGTRIPEPSSPTPDSSAKRRRTGLRSPRLHAIVTVLIAAVLALGILKQAPTWAQDSGTPSGSPVASPSVTITPAPDASRLVLTFEVLNDSGLDGTATLYEAGDKTIVDLDVKNTGDDQPAHIHAGTCGSLEPEPAFDLTALHADGKSRTVIDTPLEGLLNGTFAIDIHLSPTELGTLSACANIEGTPTVPSGSPTPEGATPTVSPEPTGQGGDTTTPTATVTEVTVAPTETASATAPAAATTPTATATTATSGSTTNNSGNGDGTGGTTSDTGTTSSTTDTTSDTTSGDGTSGSSDTTATTGTSSSTTTTTTTGDGTGIGGETASGSTYLATDGTVQTASMAASGTGPLGIIPEDTDPAIVWSIVSAAFLLFAAGTWIWIGERRSSHRQPPRWSRLGM